MTVLGYPVNILSAIVNDMNAAFFSKSLIPSIVFLLALLIGSASAGPKDDDESRESREPRGEGTLLILLHQEGFPDSLKQAMVQHYQDQFSEIKYHPKPNCATTESCLAYATQQGFRFLVLVNSVALITPSERKDMDGILRVWIGLYEPPFMEVVLRPRVYTQRMSVERVDESDWSKPLAALTQDAYYQAFINRALACTQGQCE